MDPNGRTPDPSRLGMTLEGLAPSTEIDPPWFRCGDAGHGGSYIHQPQLFIPNRTHALITINKPTINKLISIDLPNLTDELITIILNNWGNHLPVTWGYTLASQTYSPLIQGSGCASLACRGTHGTPETAHPPGGKGTRSSGRRACSSSPQHMPHRNST